MCLILPLARPPGSAGVPARPAAGGPRPGRPWPARPARPRWCPGLLGPVRPVPAAPPPGFAGVPAAPGWPPGFAGVPARPAACFRGGSWPARPVCPSAALSGRLSSLRKVFRILEWRAPPKLKRRGSLGGLVVDPALPLGYYEAAERAPLSGVNLRPCLLSSSDSLEGSPFRLHGLAPP